jgi:hypothetical protein
MSRQKLPQAKHIMMLSQQQHYLQNRQQPTANMRMNTNVLRQQAQPTARCL